MMYLYNRIISQPFALAWRLAFGCLLWWILTEGSSSSWLIGIPTVLIAVLVSFHLTPQNPYRLRFIALPSFIVFFIATSLIAGFDIAKRTLHRDLPVGSQWVIFETRLDGLPRWLFMSCLSLMPGTLSVSSEAYGLVIHSLDDKASTLSALKKLEDKLIALFKKRESDL